MKVDYPHAVHPDATGRNPNSPPRRPLLYAMFALGAGLAGCASQPPASAQRAPLSAATTAEHAPAATTAPAFATPAPDNPQAGLQSRQADGTRTRVAVASPGATPVATPAAPPSADQQARRAEVLAALEARGVPAATARQMLDQARRNATVLRLIAPPPAPTTTAASPPARRSWQAYRGRFVDPIRIRNGLAFWQEHAETLARAEREYGVPPEVVVAVIGVETVYGRNTGNFPVLDTLYSLAFHYPAHAPRDRSPYFQQELIEFMAWAHASGVSVRQPKGSFAGAVGLPQFMPSSLRDFGVAADGNRPPDLANRPDDAILSVANYLAKHGWQAGLPVFVPASIPPQAVALVDGGLKPTLDGTQLRAAGVELGPLPARAGLISGAAVDWSDVPLGLIDLPEADGQGEHRVATHNFFAITHYNRSYFYASAVADLAAALAQQSR